MATATKKARAVAGAGRGAADVADSVPMEFVIVEDNGGDYHWSLLDRAGTSLARSGSFATYQHTEDAARVILAGAGSARLNPRVETDSSLEIAS